MDMEKEIFDRDSDFIYYTDGSHSFIGQRSESELQTEWDYYYPSGYPNEQKEVVEQKFPSVTLNSTTYFNNHGGFTPVNVENTTPLQFYKSSNLENIAIKQNRKEHLSEQEKKFWHSKFANIPVMCDLFDWQMNHVEVGCPQMAMAFTLTTINGLLSGMFSMGNLTTNLYFIVSAETSIGKSQTMNLLKTLYKSVGFESRIGGKIRSDIGFRKDLAAEKYLTYMVDECGLWFKKIMSPKASEANQSIAGTFLDGFTGFGDDHNVIGKTADDEKNKNEIVLKNYAPSFFGMTTGVTFWGNLSGEDAATGLLNRFIILNAGNNDILDKKISYDSKPKNVPQSFIDFANKIKYRCNIRSDRIAGMEAFTRQELSLSVDCMPSIEKSKSEEQRLQRSDDNFGKIYARLTEITKRVAIGIQIANNTESECVCGGAFDVAYDLVKECLDYSFSAAHENIFDNDFEFFERKVIEIIKNKKDLGLSPKEWQRESFYKNNSKKIAAINLIGVLCESGEIIKYLISTTTEEKKKYNMSLYFMVHKNHAENFEKLHDKYKRAPEK